MNTLNNRIAVSANPPGHTGGKEEAISNVISDFAQHLANRGSWTKCGFIPSPRNGRSREASSIKATGIVEYGSVDNPMGEGTGFVIPDMRLPKILAAADKIGSEESLYLSEDGLLCHYDLPSGTATPCIKTAGAYGFREDLAVPFRGKTIGWEELKRGIENLGSGRG